MTVRRPIDTLRKLPRIGPIYAAQLVFGRLIPSTLFALNAYSIMERNPSEGRPETDDTSDIRWMTEGEISLFTQTAYRPGLVRDRLRRGDRCVIMTVADELVGYSWYVFGRFDQSDWLRIIIPPDAVWTSDIWVAVAHRGRGNDARLKAFASKTFEDAGVTKILSIVDVFNRRSLRAHRKIGSRIHGRLYYFRFLGLTLAKAGATARLGRWNARRRYELDLKAALDRWQVDATAVAGIRS